MNDQSSGFINTLRKTRSEDNSINPPLHLTKHQTPDRWHTLPRNLLLRSIRTRLSPRKVFKIGFIITMFYGTKRPHVRNSVREIPAFEASLIDVVTMVGAYNGFRNPAFLENGFGTGIFEGNSLRFWADGTLPEVVEVFGRPAL